MNTKRLFIALPVPEKIKEAIVGYRDQLGLNFNFIPPENFHLTVLFMGNTPEEKITGISKQLKQLSLKHSPFRLNSESLVVKSSRFHNMIWVKFHPSPEFENLTIDISNSLGFEVKRKPLPHINLVRHKNKIKGPFPVQIKESLSFEAKQVELWESRLNPKGATYFVLESFPLKGNYGKEER